MSYFWMKGGNLIVDDESRLIICDHCPCDGEPRDLYLAGGLTVEIEDPEAQSVTRFAGGLTVEIEDPEAQSVTRFAGGLTVELVLEDFDFTPGS